MHQSVLADLLEGLCKRSKAFLSTVISRFKDQGKVFFTLLRDAYREFLSDQGQLMGAAMVYYAILSITPLLLLFLSVLGYVLRFSPNGSLNQLIVVIEEQFGPQVRVAIQDLLATVEAQAITVSGIGLVALLLGASSAFRYLSTSFRRIWRPSKRTVSFLISLRSLLRDQAAGVVILFVLVVLLSISLLLLNVLQIAQSIFQNAPALQNLGAVELQPLVNVFFGMIILAFIYRYIPPIRLKWRDVWLGALLAAILWESASILLRMYFDIRTSLIYGIVGSIIVLTIWVYTLCQVLFLGAEFCKVHARWRETSKISKREK